MLDHDPILGQVGVERLLLTGQRLPPTRLVRQMARTPVLVRVLGVESLNAVVALVQHDALRFVQAVQ